MIAVAGFHCRNDDWALVHKLRVYSEFCARVIVILDRSPQSEEICRRFPKVEVHHFTPNRELPNTDEHGSATCEEGLLRKMAWDLCAAHEPDIILLGDTDEVPTPDIVGWLDSNPDPSVDCWYMDLVNLYGGALSCVTGGTSIYSYQRADSNKRGAAIRWRPGVDYKFRTGAIQHVRLEPNPLNEGRAIYDATHKLAASPKMLHYKWANWPRWQASSQCKSEKYRAYLKDAEFSPTPHNWLWRWDADQLLRSLPEPIAVVGNGPMLGRGVEIDAHGAVIRFNNFRTAGYETNVGSKTDVWVTSCWTDVESRPWTGEILTTNFASGDEQVSRWLGTHPHMRQPSSDWIAAAQGNRRLPPSTGFTLLHHLATLGKRVDAYGFDGFVGGHYWSDKPVVTTHLVDVESLVDLARMGIRFHA